MLIDSSIMKAFGAKKLDWAEIISFRDSSNITIPAIHANRPVRSQCPVL